MPVVPRFLFAAVAPAAVAAVSAGSLFKKKILPRFNLIFFAISTIISISGKKSYKMRAVWKVKKERTE